MGYIAYLSDSQMKLWTNLATCQLKNVIWAQHFFIIFPLCPLVSGTTLHLSKFEFSP